ncbi:VCBS repeat-containing protein [Ruficoccus amylovorans]|uniref:VCBS repeat-containing protein n=1 Tax=Ruficoccus amylovorans TaxID=1804625 RepID=A0A842HF58_9BACT|nr:VCBS repeat-containing protein [Ruficoccus amylovorans]MBC2595245.1 VCBS repeat-containing protein [Ruficoccus amylovorans]
MTARKTFLCLLALLLGGSLSTPANDTLPLKSGAPDGLGPLALPFLSNIPMGYADVYGGDRPDIFVLGRSKTSGLYLCEWLYDTEDGVPVFAEPVEISGPVNSRGCIFQTDDGQIHAFWPAKSEIRHSVFDKKSLSFSDPRTISLPNLPSSPAGLCVVPNPDGSFEVVLELTGDSGKRKHPESNASSPDWRPYDADGTSTEPFRFRYLASTHLPSIDAQSTTGLQQLSPNKKDVFFGFAQLSIANFGQGHQRNIIGGTRMGEFPYYRNTASNGIEIKRHGYAVDKNGVILRHTSVNSSPLAYPKAEPDTHDSDLISGGESALTFYKHIGTSAEGDPMFDDATPVLQENANLYAGALPSFSICDWNGDGVQDFICGNSTGYVLFFQNVGTDEQPAFLPGTRVQAAGEDIHIQAGYSGSVQGTKEARWGYNSPTVVDWNGDGLLDIIMGDITGEYTVYLNRGTPQEPRLDAAKPIYCYGIPLHGTWRCQAAVGQMDGRTAMVIIDDDDQFHLYWRIDDYNVQDGGKLRLPDGQFINTSYDPAGGTGRCKLSFFDADDDGLLDLVIGTGRRSAIPDKNSGWPMPALGLRTLGTPLFMKNTGTEQQPVFASPLPFVHREIGVIQPGGSHEKGAVLTTMGDGDYSLLTADEGGQVFLYSQKNLEIKKP